MKACLAAVILSLPGCAGTLNDVHTAVRYSDQLLDRVQVAYTAVCGVNAASCHIVDERLKALANAPVEESVISVGLVLETLKLTYVAGCTDVPPVLVEPCSKAKIALNDAIVVFQAVNEQIPE